MAQRIVADVVCLSPREYSELRDILLGLDTAHWLAEGHTMMELCQFTALTQAVQSRLAALVQELERRVDAKDGEAADE